MSTLVRDALDKLNAAVAALEALNRLKPADIIADLLGQSGGRELVRATARPARTAKATARPMGCIATGCKNRSKGPRFRYLCEEHKSAKPAQIEAWRKARAVR